MNILVFNIFCIDFMTTVKYEHRSIGNESPHESTITVFFVSKFAFFSLPQATPQDIKPLNSPETLVNICE